MIVDKNSVRPNAATFRKILVIAEYLRHGSKLANRQREMIIRSYGDAADTVDSYFLGKFIETTRVGDIRHFVRLTAMAVTPRDDRCANIIRDLDHRLVLLPRAKAVYLERVY